MGFFREAIILFYLPALDPDMQKMTELAEWVFALQGENSSSRELLERLSEAHKQKVDDLTNLPKDVY
jgi:hypothetical protein